MKLLLVTHYAPPHHGGIERIAEDHARTAARAGIDVTWVASRAPEDAPLDERTAWGRLVRIPAWNGLERRLGVPYPVWSPRARRTVAELVAACDLVHAHDVLYPGTSLAMGAARRLGKPALLTQHIGFVPYPGVLLRTIERMAYGTLGRRNAARAAAVAYYSETALAWLRDACGYHGNTVFLPNPVDTGLFRPPRDDAERRGLRERLGLPQERTIVLFAGRLVPKKGAALVVEAAEPDDYHLLLVGERGDLEVPRRPGIELRPFVERAAFAELLRAVDVLALPSRGEGFPLVAQEAMASGLAVVLGDDPSYARHIEPGAAMLVAPEAGALREALRRLASDPASRAQLGERARASALARWGLEACRARLIETYRALLAGGPLPGASTGSGGAGAVG